MISLDMIKAGYNAGVVKLIESPHEDGIVCQIGEHWFYFGGQTAEDYKTVEKFIKDVPSEVIVSDIFDVLEDFYNGGIDDEYRYYEAFLREHGIDEKCPGSSTERLTPFRIAITEISVKEVEIYATDSIEAEQIAHDLCSEGKINLDYDNFVERNTECRGISRDVDLKLHEVFSKPSKDFISSLEEQINVAEVQKVERRDVEHTAREGR